MQVCMAENLEKDFTNIEYILRHIIASIYKLIDFDVICVKRCYLAL